MKVLIITLFSFITLLSNVWASEGFCTFYTQKSCQIEGNSGLITASGLPFKEDALTCAMRRRDWGNKFLVYGHNTGKSVVVTLIDYGPGKKPTKRGVVIDVTPFVFLKVCGDLKQGKCLVSVQEVK